MCGNPLVCLQTIFAERPPSASPLRLGGPASSLEKMASDLAVGRSRGYCCVRNSVLVGLEVKPKKENRLFSLSVCGGRDPLKNAHTHYGLVV